MQQYTLEDFNSVHECPSCDRSFDTEYGLKQHHARGHGESLMETFVCEVCGSTEEILPCHAENKRFCSDKCMAESFSEERSEKVELPCRVCGDLVERCEAHMPDGGDPFCSRECYHDWRCGRFTGEDNWSYNHVELECHWCGDIFNKQPSRAEVSERNFCSRDCRNEWMSERPPQEHPRWRGGQSIYLSVRRLIGDTSWTESRRLARENAEHCELCGEKFDDDSEFDIHHIVPILSGGCNSQELLMPLCRSCHRKTESYTKSIPEVEPVLVE